MKIINEIIKKFKWRKSEDKNVDNHKKDIDFIKEHNLFQMNEKDELMSLGCWRTERYFSTLKEKNSPEYLERLRKLKEETTKPIKEEIKPLNQFDYITIGIGGKEAETLKKLCGSIRTYLAWHTVSSGTQINMNEEIINNYEDILDLTDRIKEFL
ncbi:MAG: hypothetical protein ABIE46_03160 [Patescibacteria group bacterium]